MLNEASIPVMYTVRPAWEGTQQAEMDLVKGWGNGGGATTSLTVPSTEHLVRASRGSATFRLTVHRACLRCIATFGQRFVSVTILTDASQVIAIPHASTPLTQRFKNVGDTGSWLFNVYAADELGDRAYTVAGPTYVELMPQWYVSKVAPGTTKLTAPSADIRTVSTLDASFPQSSVDYFGAPVVSITAGTRNYNGIPVSDLVSSTGAETVYGPARLLPAGMVQVTLTDLPAAEYPLRFSLGADLPVRFFGDAVEPTVSFALTATRIAVSDSCAGNFNQGDECNFDIYAVAQAPGSTTASAWVRSVLPVVGVARVSATCGECGADAVRFSSSVLGFSKGVASVKVSFVGAPLATCTCRVTVSPPSSVTAGDQVFTTVHSRVALRNWYYESSTSFFVADNAGPTAASHGATDRLHNIRLRAYDEQRRTTGIGGLTWADPSYVVIDPNLLRPAGCFNCSDPVAGVTHACKVTRVTGDDISFAGFFHSTGFCDFPPEAVDGLPQTEGPTVRPQQTLSVSVLRPNSVEAAPVVQGSDVSNFTNLDGITPLGELAAVVGVGSSLTVRVIDAQGQQVLGDHHTTLFLYGVEQRRGRSFPSQTLVSSRGQVTFALDETHVGEASWEGGIGSRRQKSKAVKSAPKLRRASGLQEFNYNNPAVDWPQVSPVCNGFEQSPVRIDTSRVIESGSSTLLSAISYTAGFGTMGTELTNTGTGVVLKGAFGHLTVGSEHYDAVEIRFHFPAEHALDSGLYTGEMQIVHQRRGACGDQPALSCNTGLLMVSVFLKESLLPADAFTGSELLDALEWDNLPEAGASRTVTKPVDLRTSLADPLGGNFWRYDGSLTTPPCTEGVKWFIAQRPLTIKGEQYDAFKALYPDPANNRPLQPLQGRSVVRNSFEVLGQSQQSSYTYANPDTEWPLMEWTVCGGTSQSPIDIQTALIAARGGHHLTEVTVYETVPAGLTVENNGHGLNINGEFGYVSSGGYRYKAAGVHFHFPSEHSVNGVLYDGELHIVHMRDAAITGGQELLVIGVLLQAGGVDSPLLTALGLDSPPANKGDTAILTSPIDLGGALEEQLSGSFWRYDGSLTTPPCSETVRWHVLQTPLIISDAQRDAFKRIFPNPANNRPVQPLNGRPVVSGAYDLAPVLPDTISYVRPDYDWPRLNGQCSGMMQSPINIDTGDLAATGSERLNAEIGKLEEAKLENELGALRLEGGGGGGVQLGETEYHAKGGALHFPSEHSINGALSSGELQLLFQREGAVGDSEMLGIAILLEEGEEGDLLDALGFEGTLPTDGEDTELGEVELGELLEDALEGSFFRYDGSLTQPPCSENVKWFVLRRRVSVTAAQIAKAKALFPDPANNRPVQPLGERLVASGLVALPYARTRDDGWMFTVRTNALTVNGLIDPFDSIEAVGPLRFVRRAQTISIEVRLGGSPTWEPALGQPWVLGFPMQLRIMAIDATGAVVSAETDMGNNAELVFLPAAVPCVGLDLINQMTSLGGDRSCTQWPGAGGTCETQGWDSIWCDNGGWELYEEDPSNHELELREGRATLDRVRYTGEAGLSRFFLTTQDFGPGRRADGSWVPHPYTKSAGELTVQKLTYLFLSGRGAQCYKLPGVSYYTCDMPETWGGALVTRQVPLALAPRPGVEPPDVIWADRTTSQTTDPDAGTGGRRGEVLQDETLAPTVMPTVTIQQKEIELGKPMRLTYLILDEWFSIVFGDSVSQILVQSTCTEPGATSYVGRKMDAAAAAAVNSSFTGDIDVVSPLLFPVQNGAALADELYFNGPCANMTLVMKCVGAEQDTMDLCKKLPPMRTERFAVVLPEGTTLPPPLPPPPDLRYTIVLRTTEPQPNPADAQRVFADYARTISAADFNSQLGAVLTGAVQQVDRVVLNAICGIPTTRSPREPISSDYTEAGSADGGLCVEHAATGHRRSRLLQETSMDVVSIFTVVFSDRAAGVDPHALSDAVDTAIRDDVQKGSQVAAFSQINSGTLVLTSEFTAPVPSTPVPTPALTPVPGTTTDGTTGGITLSPVAGPPTTGGTPPGTPVPPPITPLPVGAPEEPITIGSSASALLVKLATTVVAAAAVLLV
eukprot:Hpha_TRINITY_DN16123_c1_g3::TRINITY_DN16123_c1_g3_i2::g.7442::m.7442